MGLRVAMISWLLGYEERLPVVVRCGHVVRAGDKYQLGRVTVVFG